MNPVPTSVAEQTPEQGKACPESAGLDALAECDLRFRLVSEAVTGLIIDWNLQDDEYYRSNNIAAILGYAPDTVPATFAWARSLIHPDDVTPFDRTLAAWLSSKELQHTTECRVRHQNGSYRHMRVHGVMVRDPVSHAPQRIVACALDVTTEKQALAALQASEERYRLATQAMEGIAFEWNLETGYFFRSDNITTLLGYERKEVEPTLDWGYRIIHPQDSENFRRDVERFVQGPQPFFHSELRIKHRNGEYRWIRIHALKDRPGDGKFKRIIGCYVDITSQKQAERERAEFERHLYDAQKLESLGDLAGGLAHDFNNLLTVIQANLSLIKADLSAQPAHLAMLDQVENASRHAVELCRQMLAFSGRGKFENRPFGLSELIESSRILIVSAIGKLARLNFRLTTGLQHMAGDPSQVYQVILSLAHNAAEALPSADGLVEIGTGRSHLDRAALDACHFSETVTPGDFVWLEVRDSGIGMSPETQKRVFEPFFTTKFTGRGLGLAAVAGIVRGHRGAVQLETKPGQGSVFRVYFPVDPGSSPPLLPAQKEASRPGRPGANTVLVVDDEPAVRGVLVRILAKKGFAAIEAADGEEALDMIERHADSLCLMLLDLTMPRRDGLSTLRELRRRRHDIPVLAMSGYFSEELPPGLAQLGAEFLAKPFQTAELLKTIDSLLQRSPAN